VARLSRERYRDILEIARQASFSTATVVYIFIAVAVLNVDHQQTGSS
jgi:hypothetical protein